MFSCKLYLVHFLDNHCVNFSIAPLAHVYSCGLAAADERYEHKKILNIL